MLPIDLSGKRALVCGVGDNVGFGWAIARALADGGASVCLAAWPPALGIFQTMFDRGKFDESRVLRDGSLFEYEKLYPLDAAYDCLDDAPEAVRNERRYRDRGDFSIQGLTARFQKDFGEESLDILVHSLANSPEISKPLIDTSRAAYSAALGVSAYSLTSLVHHLGPLMVEGGSVLSLSFFASQKTFPGYGGGMSSAKAALESDTRTLAYEAGRRHKVRVNTISAGPFASRAASSIGVIDAMITHYAEHSPLPHKLKTEEVGHTAAFLASPLASGITGTTIYVDKGYHTMGKPLEEWDAR